MNVIKCLLVDDEPVASRILEGYLDQLEGYEVLASCTNAMQAFSYLNNNEVDLLFLDIEMPKMKGLELLRSLKTPPDVILITAYREFALESYEFSVVDYLLKPVSLERFLRSLDKFQTIRKTSKKTYLKEKEIKPDFFFIKTDGLMKRVDTQNILFIEGLGNYVKIMLPDETHIFYTSMKNILEKLSDNFIQIHKSYLVNVKKIDAFNSSTVHIGDTELTLTKTYRDQVLKKLEKLNF